MKTPLLAREELTSGSKQLEQVVTQTHDAPLGGDLGESP
jgi:hypothetical protein